MTPPTQTDEVARVAAMRDEDSPPPAGLPVVAVSETEPAARSIRLLEWLGLGAVLLCAGALRLVGLGQNGYGNFYYAAAVRSMLATPSNFFFGSYDPVGFVTVDKPPAALWVQALSAWVLGYTGFNLLLPQALMGIAAVGLVYLLVRRVAGGGAGLLAGLILALTPICVAVDRDNLPDTALVLVLLLATWALSRATETGRLGPLLLAMTLVGVGFNIKMLAAFLVLPTFYLAYLIGSPARWWVRLVHLSAATAVLTLVSLSWSLAVELTPADRRPYVGGSKNNSALELALGYNGLGRVFGGSGNFNPSVGPHQAGKGGAADDDKDPRAGGKPLPPPGKGWPGPGFPPPGGFGPGFPPGPPGGFPPGGFGGTPGLGRFTGPLLAGQITWLFPLAVVGAGAAAGAVRLRRPPSPLHVALWIWTGWLATHWVVFSFAQGIFHEYYTTVMGPAVAALGGIGVVALWRASNRNDWCRSLLPGTLLLTAGWQVYLISRYEGLRYSLLPAVLVGAALGTTFVVSAPLLARRWPSVAWRGLGTGVGVAALLLGPLTWCLAVVAAPGNSMMPAADPSALLGGKAAGGMPGGPMIGLGLQDTERLVSFLKANRHGERFLMAAMESISTSPLIIQTDESVVALGGFNGGDRILSAEAFAALVESGQIRFFLVSGPPGMGKGRGGPPGAPPDLFNTEIQDWVLAHGKVVDPKLWRAEDADAGNEPQPGPPVGPGGMMRFARLYDCRPTRALIATPAP